MNGYYKYIINIENGKYWFGLYPNNNNKQPLLESCVFDSLDICKNEIDIFKKSIIENDLKTYDNNIIKFVQKGKKFNFVYKIGSKIYSRKICLESREQLERDIKLIYDNINAPIKERKFE